MRTVRENFGPFKGHIWVYKKRTIAEEIALEWIRSNSKDYTVLDLDLLMDHLKDFMRDEYDCGIKETIKIRKSPGATIAGSGAVDHYQISISNKRDGSGRICISEPIGTDINRHKLIPKK